MNHPLLLVLVLSLAAASCTRSTAGGAALFTAPVLAAQAPAAAGRVAGDSATEDSATEDSAAEDSAAEDWAKVGVVGVDTGQLLILDPSYIDSEWIPNGEGTNWQVQYWGRDEAKLEPDFGPSPIACKNGDEAAKLDERIQASCRENEWMAVTWVQSGSSYEQCAALSASEDGYGQLNYKRGHAGLGVVASSGYGDGMYPVYARRNDKGVIVELRVMLDSEGKSSKRMQELVERQQKANKKK